MHFRSDGKLVLERAQALVAAQHQRASDQEPVVDGDRPVWMLLIPNESRSAGQLQTESQWQWRVVFHLRRNTLVVDVSQFACKRK